ncbi:MAG: response regulator transcription factor [Bacteroidia bacterium]|jgi:two-component system LytT family response regulator|nr:response regulator transcription factor [Bacteroidia bacterium]
MLHAIIVDDERLSIQTLKHLLASFSDEITVIADTTDPMEGVELINKLKPDVVFMDIVMPGINGLDLIGSLSFTGFYLVFTSAFSGFGIEAIKLKAFDYLLKPVQCDELHSTLSRIQKNKIRKNTFESLSYIFTHHLNSEHEKVTVHSNDGINVINYKEIIYIEAQANRSVFMLTQGRMLISTRPLKSYDTITSQSNSHLIRIHNSYIVNLNYAVTYIRENGGYLKMNNQKLIPVSKQKRDILMQALNI